jgi:hypothetical protein
VLAVDTQRKAVASAFSSTPLAEDSIGGVWGSTGVSIDGHGNIYAVTGASGSEKHAPPLRNWAQSVLKFDPVSEAGLTLRGVYTPFNYCRTEAGDIDLGSSGVAILPEADGKRAADPLLAVGGKQGNAYLLGRSSFTAPGDERRPCSEDSDTDQSLLAPEPQPQFAKRGPLNIFGPYSESDGMLDRAKNRATPAFFRNAVGGEYLFYTGNRSALRPAWCVFICCARRASLRTFGWTGGRWTSCCRIPARRWSAATAVTTRSCGCWTRTLRAARS